MVTEFSKELKRAISSRETDTGSGRNKPAENDAFAIASWCGDMVC
jgi:hypothetical protein